MNWKSFFLNLLKAGAGAALFAISQELATADFAPLGIWATIAAGLVALAIEALNKIREKMGL